MIRIVRMSPTDSGSVLADLDREIFPGDERVDLNNRRTTWFFAEDTETPRPRPHGPRVGFGGVLVGGPDAFFVRGGVLPRARGRGIYQRLIRRCEREALDRGALRIWTYVLPWNAPSINALISRGWRAFQRQGGDEGVLYLGRVLR